MDARVVEQRGSFRLIEAGGRYAVIEARAEHVYPVTGDDRHAQPDTAEGMARAAGEGWLDEAAARQRLDELERLGRRYAERIW